MELKIDTFYKDDQDKTILIFADEVIHGEKIFLAWWHEQMLGEPNHCAIHFTTKGYSCLPLDGKIRIFAHGKLVRACTELETRRYLKEIQE